MFGQRKIHRVNNAVFTESYWIMQWLIFFTRQLIMFVFKKPNAS